MNNAKPPHNRILAIYPNSRGFGYAVLEERATLVDWGTVQTKHDKNRQCLSRIWGFIKQYRPDVVVAEDPRSSLHRRLRIRNLLIGISKLSVKMDITFAGLTRDEVREHFRTSGGITKQKVAEGIAGRFPELASRLPAPRKAWMSEDPRMAIFDAVALALCLASRRNRKKFNR